MEILQEKQYVYLNFINALLSRLTLEADEITGDLQCWF
jgi:hypothetical protein